MDERLAISRLHRRLGFGVPPGGLTAATERGLAIERASLLDPAAHGFAPPPDPFEALDLTFEPGNGSTRKLAAAAVTAWFDRFVSTQWVLADRIAWFWHGHLVSSLGKVKAPDALANQIRLFWRLGLGDLRSLITEITTDPAMLVYLDGKDSTRQAPNENFSRELMELFALGVGNYSEADVVAGARALTGWTVNLRNGGGAVFRGARHDAMGQRFLGVDGVDDVESVISAVLGHEACAPFIVGRFAREFLGPRTAPSAVGRLAAGFRAGGYRIDSLLDSVVDELINGTDGGPIVSAPVPWLVAAQRITGARLDPSRRLAALRAAGQLPLNPPTVAGWPRGEAWYGSATVVARLNLALAVAAATPRTNRSLQAATAGDWLALADEFGLATGFGPTTARGLAIADSGEHRLALALVSPEYVEV